MAAGMWFWLIYVFCLLFGGWSIWPTGEGKPNYRPFGAVLVIFVLLALLGYKTFGSPLQ